jgi:uncharacterized protein (TIGR00255 family)
MIKSMTGYGKAIAETPQKKITIEIKSLNSKQLDLNAKLPWLYKEKEPEIRNLVSQTLDRGKIDLSVYFDILEDEGVPVINKSIVKNYYKQLKEIAGELEINIDDQILPTIMRLPDSLKTEKPELPEDEWANVKKQILGSINVLDLYRIEEGKSIETDLKKRISGILESLSAVETFEPGRIEKVREKLISILKENKVRLKKNCEYFLETIETPSPNGKILGFIAQEIGREINTMGSKANDASIQKLVVMMKDELEKIKEQTNNIL